MVGEDRVIMRGNGLWLAEVVTLDAANRFLERYLTLSNQALLDPVSRGRQSAPVPPGCAWRDPVHHDRTLEE